MTHHEDIEHASIAVLIPAYRPSHDLKTLTDSLLEEGFRVAVVDDGSGSGFEAAFAALSKEVALLVHETNQGKGRALKTGLRYIRRNLPACEAVVTADADGQHRLEDILKVSGEVSVAEEALVLGSRRFEGAVPLKSRFGNTLTRYVFAVATGKKLYDTQTGLRAFATELIPSLLDVPGERYEYELNVLLWAAKRRMPIREVAIRTVYLDNNSSSHFRPVRDSIIIYANIIKFTLSSLTAFGIDFICLFILRALTSHLSIGVSLLVSAVGARLISAFCNFMINRRVVFKSTGNVFASAAGYFALVGAVLIANYGMLYAMNVVVGISLLASKLVADTTLFVGSYFAQKRLVFRRP
jgi:glycosyltransferase involved in cell wall biosynthesis